MRHFFCFKRAIAALLISGVPSVTFAGTINIGISGVRNDAGVIRCGLFASPDGFRVPGRELREATGTIAKGKAKCVFASVPDGTYAIAIFHAEKNEKKLETGLFGQPKQGVGFSRNPSITFGPPSFSSASFQVGPKPVSMQIKMVY